MRLENLERVSSLKEQLEKYEEMLDIMLTSNYCILAIEDAKTRRRMSDVINEEKDELKRIYQKKRDEVISELKELGVEV
nr:MAG TPA: hypothetical protein [Caudoviricetes sp.]DAS55848.1 MAG TPA: hypothetical protein [Caudoviricetes sp.]